MVEEKSKLKAPPPDILLARAFGFTAEDLAVNRSGYMSRRQQGIVDVVIQRVFDLIFRLMKREAIGGSRRGFRPVSSVCGRARLARFMVDRPFQSGRGGGGSFYVYYTLTFDNRPVEFRLTEKQYAVLAEGLVYRLHYDPDTSERIMSIERPDGGCDS